MRMTGDFLFSQQKVYRPQMTGVIDCYKKFPPASLVKNTTSPTKGQTVHRYTQKQGNIIPDYFIV